MLVPFYRKIRQLLLSEGKTSKYFLYAIGEIALVMVGILLALQVNLWNENRKRQKKETYLLSKLKANLEEDVTLFDECLEANSMFVRKTDSLLIMMEDPDSFTRKDFSSQLRFVVNFRRFSPVKVTFDDMVTSGKTDIINNQELMEQLSLYYRDIENYNAGGAAATATYTREIFSPYLLKFDYWDNHNIGTFSKMDEYHYDFDIQKKSIAEYADDPFVLNALRMKMSMLLRMNEVYGNHQKDTKRIIKLLNKELTQ